MRIDDLTKGALQVAFEEVKKVYRPVSEVVIDMCDGGVAGRLYSRHDCAVIEIERDERLIDDPEFMFNIEVYRDRVNVCTINLPSDISKQVFDNMALDMYKQDIEAIQNRYDFLQDFEDIFNIGSHYYFNKFGYIINEEEKELTAEEQLVEDIETMLTDYVGDDISHAIFESSEFSDRVEAEEFVKSFITEFFENMDDVQDSCSDMRSCEGVASSLKEVLMRNILRTKGICDGVITEATLIKFRGDYDTVVFEADLDNEDDVNFTWLCVTTRDGRGVDLEANGYSEEDIDLFPTDGQVLYHNNEDGEIYTMDQFREEFYGNGYRCVSEYGEIEEM